MKRLLQAMMWVALMCVVASCANKGKLLTPTQMQAQEEKKARRAQAKAAKEAKEKEDEAAAPDQSPDQSKDQPDQQNETVEPPVAASATSTK